MPFVALISNDSTLEAELETALRDTPWSVRRVETTDVEPASIEGDVVAIDGLVPHALDWLRASSGPTLAVSSAGANRAGIHADDVVFRPLRAGEIVFRLDRLIDRGSGSVDGRRYAKSFESVALGVVVLGPNLEMVFANPRAYEIVGHREGTISVDAIDQLVSSQDLPQIRATLSNRQYPRGMDVQLVRRDGTVITCSCSFAPLVGAEGHTVISFEDVSEQRGTERELLKAMEFLESLIDASVDAIVATDMDHRIVLFNPSAETISGRHAADVLGRLRLEDFLGRAATELVTGRLLSAEHGGEGRLEPTMMEFHDVHGARIPVQLSASVIYEHGAPSAIVLIVADLRDRLRVEERLAEAQKKLAFTEKQGVLAELAGTAAHELNQPLTSMMAYAELLLRQSEPGSAPAKAARVLIREAERMADIVRKIGKITRYETTAYVGQQKIFDLDRAADAQGDPGGKG